MNVTFTGIKNDKYPEFSLKPQKERKKYQDPLNSWKFRWMSYSNEAGTFISEIAPKLGAALWVPSFMYIGADVYDKYKNNKDKYDPSARRAFDRAIYQGISNLAALPLLITAGQKIVSPLGMVLGNKISIDKKAVILDHINKVLMQGVNEELNDKETFRKLVKVTLENKMSSKKSEMQNDNVLKKAYKFLTNKYTIALGNKQKTIDYAQKKADELFEIRDLLLSRDSSKKVSASVRNKYFETLSSMKSMHGFDYANNAIRSALIKVCNRQMFENKILKTMGGFVALALFGTTVSKYVEKKLVGTYIDGGLNFAYKGFQNTNLKRVFDEMANKS
ncbi:hypothetical protein J6E39_00845 [bacterium]|nr:hypothetical protein [bacterium]